MPSDIVAPSTTDNGSMDAAFNAGFDSTSSERSAPMRPQGGDFSEFSNVAPLEPLSNGSTVDVAGPAFETYTVKKGDSLWAIAKRYDVSVNELYSANDLNKNSVIKVGQQIQIPVDGASMTVETVSPDSYQPTSLNMSTETYTVRGGDSLSKIAKQFGTSVQAIKATNNKTTDVIRIGEVLTIPVAGSSAGSTTTTTTTTTKPAPSISVTNTSDGSRTHVVQAGEYPATIARKYGMTSSELLAMNGITDPRKLQVGQKLKVSATGSAANVDSRTETVTGPAPTPAPAASQGPVQIRVIEADPLVESDVAQISEAPAEEIDPDSLFENAVEIPVIRMEDAQ